MVGEFTNILPDRVNWSKSATMLTQEIDRQAVGQETLQVEIRPARFGFDDKSGAQTTTVVAVYAPLSIMAEARGICTHLAYENTDKEGLSLSGSQFHTTINLQKVKSTRNVILSSHATFLSNYSTYTISTEPHNLNKRPTTDLGKELLPTSFPKVKDIQSKRDLI